jgi:hypothetical protein
LRNYIVNSGDFKISSVANGRRDGGDAGSSTGPGGDHNGIRSISLKRREVDGSIIAEFARPLNGRGETNGQNKMTDLSGCTVNLKIKKNYCKIIKH